MAQVGVSSWSCFTGLGSPDSQHNALMLSETKHAYVIWALVYNFALAFIKTSICLTLIRIFAYQTKYIYTSVFSLIGITWMGYLVSLMGTLLDCRPISAAWDEKGKCSNRFTFASLTYTVTATALFTDMSIVVLTAIVLWRTMMPWSTKIQVFGFMSFASLASVFLIIRSIYISHFAGRTNIDTSNLGTINAASKRLLYPIVKANMFFINTYNNSLDGPHIPFLQPRKRCRLYSFLASRSTSTLWQKQARVIATRRQP